MGPPHSQYRNNGNRNPAHDGSNSVRSMPDRRGRAGQSSTNPRRRGNSLQRGGRGESTSRDGTPTGRRNRPNNSSAASNNRRRNSTITHNQKRGHTRPQANNNASGRRLSIEKAP